MRSLVALFLIGLGACNGEPEDTQRDNEAPAAAITTPGPGTSVHAGTSVAFTSTCTDPEGASVTHAWDFGGAAAASSEASPTVSLEVAGTFTVSYTCTDVDGATSDPATVSITVANEAPQATIDAPVDQVVVALGADLQVSGVCTDADGDTVTAAWSAGAESADGTNGTLTFAAAGDLTLTLTCTDEWGATGTATQTVQSRALPKALYRSTEVQSTYDDLFWADVPGAPTLLNDALFAPGGRVQEFALFSDDRVVYAADHEEQDRYQYYLADLTNPGTAVPLSPTPVTGTSPSLIPHPAVGFAWFADDEVPDKTQAWFVDLRGEPALWPLTPDLPDSYDVVGLWFSPSGNHLLVQTQYVDTVTYWDFLLVDLSTSPPTIVPVVERTRTYAVPFAFSHDDAYVAWSYDRAAYALDLETLGDETPDVRTVRSGGKSGGVRYAAFAPESHHLVYTHDPDLSNQWELFLADIDGLFAGGSFQDERISADLTVGAVEDRYSEDPIRLCGSHLVFSLDVDEAYHHSLYHVDLSDLQNPGPSEPVHGPLTGNEVTYIRDLAWSADCERVLYVAVDDLATSTDTTDEIGLFLVDLADPDAKLVHRPSSSRLQVSPSGQIGWLSPREGTANTEDLWTATLGIGDSFTAPARRTAFLEPEGAVDRFTWLADGRLLLSAEGGLDPGAWLLDGSTATKLSQDVQGQALAVLGLAPSMEQDSALFLRDFQLYEAPFANPEAEVKVSGTSTANSAFLGTARMAPDGQTALFVATDGDPARSNLYAVPVGGSAAPLKLNDEAMLGTYVVDGDDVIYIGLGDSSRLRRAPWAGGASSNLDLGFEPPDTVRQLYMLSPTGLLLFRATVDDVDGTWVLPPGGAPTRIEDSPLYTSRPILFSPSGRYLLYVTNNDRTHYRLVDLQAPTPASVVATPDGVSGTNGLRSAAFVDDTALVVQHDANDEGELQLYLVQTSDLRTARLNAPLAEGESTSASWDLTGQTVVFERRAVSGSGFQNRLVAVDVAQPSTETLITDDFDADESGLVRWALGETWVAYDAYAYDQGGRHLYARPLDGSVPAIGPLDPADREVSDFEVIERPQGTWVAMTVYDANPRFTVLSRDLAAADPVAVSAQAAEAVDFVVHGDWLWFWDQVAGQCGPLSVQSLSHPEGGTFAIGGDPILGGCARLPDYTD